MIVSVLNGSPHGEHSATLQHVRFLASRWLGDEVRVLQVGSEVEEYCQPGEARHRLLDTIAPSNLLLVCFPVYLAMAPAQLMRLLEHLRAEGGDCLRGKPVALLCTGEGFGMALALRSLRGALETLGCLPVGEWAGEPDSFLRPEGRERLLVYWQELHWAVERGMGQAAKGDEPSSYVYSPTGSARLGIPDQVSKTIGRNTVLVTDCEREHASLRSMINTFKLLYPLTIREVSISSFYGARGCIGCSRCAHSRRCIHSDGFEDLIENHLKPADALVFAAPVAGRLIGSAWKVIFDRLLMTGRWEATRGKPAGWLLSGSLSREGALCDWLQIVGDTQGIALVGMACDEAAEDLQVTDTLLQLAERLAWRVEHTAAGGPPTDWGQRLALARMLERTRGLHAEEQVALMREELTAVHGHRQRGPAMPPPYTDRRLRFFDEALRDSGQEEPRKRMFRR